MAKSDTENNEHTAWIQELGEFQESDLDQRQQARECDRFLLDKDGQWEESIARTLDSQKRPRYTFDQTTPAIEFVMADIEDMDFSVNVKPHSGAATKDLALLREDMIRSIENDSNAPKIYRDACRRMIRRGFDAWIVKAKFRDEWSFEQDLFIENIPNAINRVWLSNTSTMPDSSDSDEGYVLTSMSPDAYYKQFPEGKGVSVGDADLGEHWDQYRPEVITIGERYYKKDTMKEVAQLSNGEVVEVDDNYEKVIEELALSGVTEVRRKKVKDYKIYHRIFDGGGMLSNERETPFRSMPIVTVYGNYELLGESSKITYHGQVLKQMDYQRVLNYATSREIEEGALAPRDKVWMTKGQAKGNTQQLESMNVSADPVQFYSNDSEAAAPPFKMGGAQPNAHLSILGANMAQGIQIAGGVNNAMNGDFAGRMSGEAIKAQIDRGQGSTRKWVNALVNGIKRTGEILVEAMPVVYDTKRQLMLIGVDGTESLVEVNNEVYDKETQKMVKVNNLNDGKYKVFCDAGPAYSNRMEAGLAALLEYAAIDPTVVQQGGDIMLKAIDAPLVDKIAERKRSQMLATGMIPPDQMTEEEKERALMAAQQPQQPTAEDTLMQIEMLKQQTLMLTQKNKAGELQLNMAKAIADNKGREEELNSKLAVESAKIDQGQQKINNDARDKATKNALSMAELELKAQQELNRNIQENIKSFNQF